MANTKIPVELSSTPGIVDNSNATAITIDSSENVGIGTTSPSSFNGAANNLVVGSGVGSEGLTIYSANNSYGSLYFADGTTGAEQYAGWVDYNHNTNFMRIATNGSEKVRIDSSGNVGIGTSSPSAKLHVANAATEEYIFETTSNNTRSQVEVKSKDSSGNAVQTRIASMGDGVYGMLYTVTNHNLTFATNNAAPQMTLNTSGNVGIGTTSPSTKLHVTGTVGAFHGNNDNRILMSNNGTVGSINVTYGTIGPYLPLTFLTGDTERMRIDISGNLLVGMTSTGSTGGMYIDQTGNVIAASVGANGTSTKFKWTSPVFNAGSQEKHGIQLYNGASQNIQFGFISDSGGNQGAFIDTSSTNLGTIIRSDSNGVRLANGATSWSSYSDSRLKDVTGEIPNALDKIDAMRGVLFSWNDDEENTQRCGVIAQEVQAVLPEVVDTDTDYLQVRYTEMIPLLIQGIKEQQTIIESLKARITALES